VFAVSISYKYCGALLQALYDGWKQNKTGSKTPISQTVLCIYKNEQPKGA
jgi:hypothetical protein